MTTYDLTASDPTMELGRKVLHSVDDQWDSTADLLGVTKEEALAALTAFAARLMSGERPLAPSAECDTLHLAPSGWCIQHGVFHAPAVTA